MGERKTRVVLLCKGKHTKEGRFWLRHLIFSVCGELLREVPSYPAHHVPQFSCLLSFLSSLSLHFYQGRKIDAGVGVLVSPSLGLGLIP